MLEPITITTNAVELFTFYFLGGLIFTICTFPLICYEVFKLEPEGSIFWLTLIGTVLINLAFWPLIGFWLSVDETKRLWGKLK